MVRGVDLIYCFDTSAVNRLLDDPEREAIVKAILAAGSFRISAYNVLEVAKTAEPERRTTLIELMKRLAQRKRPLDRPNTLLLTYATAHANRSSRVDVNRDENLEGLWIALNEPNLVDDEATKEAREWADELEKDFDQCVRTKIPSAVTSWCVIERPLVEG